MNYLSELNAHVRDKDISFEEGPHIYTVLGERGTYTSVTTIVHKNFPHFDSVGLINKILKSKKMADENYKYYGMSYSQIQKMWDDNRDAAATAGTKLHYDIECYYNKCPNENTSIEYQYFTNFCQDYPYLEAYRTEWMVYYEELKISGSIDMVFRDIRDGTYWIYDWKRSKEIEYENNFCENGTTEATKNLPNLNFWHYSLQLGIYKKILEEKYGLKINGMYLIVLHPNNTNYERIEVANLEKEIQEIFDLRKKQIFLPTHP
jgi:ATP-dependent exoDNAse (exonuclease V) beta subunit